MRKFLIVSLILACNAKGVECADSTQPCISSQVNEDSQHRISVDGNLADYQHEDWKAFKYDGEVSSYLLQTILNGLCADGHLSPGNYVINVSW